MGALVAFNVCVVVLVVVSGLDTVDSGSVLKTDGGDGDSVEVLLLDGAIDSGNVVSTPG